MELNGTDVGNENVDGSRLEETVCNDLGQYRHNLKRLKEKITLSELCVDEIMYFHGWKERGNAELELRSEHWQ